MSFPKPVNVGLGVGYVLVSHFLNFEFLDHFDPHDGIKDLEKGFRKGVSQHNGMNIDKQLLV